MLALGWKNKFLGLNEKVGLVWPIVSEICATYPMVAKLCEMPKISETKPTLDKRQRDGPFSDYVAC